MIFIIHNHNHNHNHNTNPMGDSVMNAVNLFIFYFGLVILYHATTRIK